MIEFVIVVLPAFAEEKSAAALLDLKPIVDLAEERERRVDHRGPSAGQIKEAGASTIVEEEAGQGLRVPLADVWVGTEGQPWLGHTLESAERPVRHPRQDFDEGPLGEAPQGVLFLFVRRLQMVHTVSIGSRSHMMNSRLDQG